MEQVASPVVCEGRGAPMDTSRPGDRAHTGRRAGPVSRMPLTQVDYTQRTSPESSGTAANGAGTYMLPATL